MSDLPTYSFLPWLRHGVANTITTADVESGGAPLRASVSVKLQLTGQPVATTPALDQTIEKQVMLYGPGDIVGIEAKAIVKVEPRHWITNFEPNYLPYIEFYDEDFPWRYTPAAPGPHHRLRPWIMLVVLKADEFQDGKNVLDRPLPFITVAKQRTLPLADDLWAWAHVHVNRSLNGADPKKVTESNIDLVVQNLSATLAQNPDLASARIVCPRRLEPSTTYYAFVVPVFEAGRLAGLGQPLPPALTATQSAWSSVDAGVELPVYYRWQFSTGTAGDFEYLVRLLQPKTADPRLGRRDMDASLPGANLPPWQEAPGLPAGQETGGLFKLGGALRAPLSFAEYEKIKKYEEWTAAPAPAPHPFQESLAALLNLEDDYKRLAAQVANQQSGLFPAVPEDPDDPEDLDPVVVPPIYGRWHAKTPRLLTDADGNALPETHNWIHELNLDPRFRAAAGFGTAVVQDKQEDYMFAAWQQIGDVLKGNQLIRQGQLSLHASTRWHQRYLAAMAVPRPQQLFLLTAPAHRRVIHEGVTILHALRQAPVPPSIVSPAMRRILRPGGRLMTRLGGTTPVDTGSLLVRLNAGEIHAAPPKTAGPSTQTLSAVDDQLVDTTIPTWADDLLQRFPRLKWIALIVAILLALLLLVLLPPLAVGLGLAAVVLVAGVALFRLISSWEQRRRQAVLKDLEQVEPERLEELPARPDFRLTAPGDPFRPGTGTSDSEEGRRFRESLIDLAYLAREDEAAGRQPPLRPLDFPALQAAILERMHPNQTIPPLVMGKIRLPGWVTGQFVRDFDPIMAYPVIDLPMYKPLADGSTERFLPNLHLIENNTISLLKTNQKFIESYLVGINHEFGRELLWREYPTDQRGSSFRQFWDVSSVLKPTTFPEPKKEKERQWREGLYDIPPIHNWSATSQLGDHDNRELPGQVQEEEVVLVVRGELLKKYPTAVIYAHKAEWVLLPSGKVDLEKMRKLAPLTTADEADLADGQVADSNTKLKTPLYGAQIKPDIYFFGFNLTVEEVKGAKGDEPDAPTRPGWFFVIKERPGEPRFGLDIDKATVKNSWNDLSWEDVALVDGTLDVGGSAPVVNLTTPTKGAAEDNESFQARRDQYEEDKNLQWSAQTNAAELAYILYQVPVLVAVHGAEMLPADLAAGDL
ncbi:hypothetical protein [Neolewinella litorea]|uniref:Uncharacterized protein n=1 Tax=Neolewinella litorea TaxID=2562452 RepID=A0A4S4NC65_9BACT|nr:hypothetical protein [Neolewinella litorea]THH35621.1 hypothetical protein E4021_16165 [Neolewinella litorea]